MNLKQTLTYFKKYADKLQRMDLTKVKHADIIKEAEHLDELLAALKRLEKRVDDRQKGKRAA